MTPILYPDTHLFDANGSHFSPCYKLRGLTQYQGRVIGLDKLGWKWHSYFQLWQTTEPVWDETVELLREKGWEIC